MSDLITLGRDILAVCSPATGTRASGAVTVTASDADVTIPVANYLLPVVGGQVEAKWAFKVSRGPNSDKSWTATSDGTAISAMSNLGGARYNVPDATRFVLDPPIDGIESIEATGDFSGGVNPSGLATLHDAVMWEELGAPISDVIHKSGISKFPAAVLGWAQSEPADGSTDGYSNGSRTSRKSMTYRETFSLSIIANRAESGHHRRQQGLAIISELCDLMLDRHSVDGRPFSNPRGIQIIRRYREKLNSQFYKKFDVYVILLGVMHSIEQRQYRTWDDYLANNIDVLTMQRPPLENQGDYTTVDDMEVEMIHD